MTLTYKKIPRRLLRQFHCVMRHTKNVPKLLSPAISVGREERIWESEFEHPRRMLNLI